MIAHPLKTVFVHIPKTAGNSIEQVFLSCLGLDQNSRSALLLRKKLDHESGPPRLAHLTAAEYQSCGFLTKEQAAEYFFFTVVRNPWSRVKSCYHYLRFDQHLSLNDFVLNRLETEIQSGKLNWFIRPQTDFIYDEHDKPLVDTVCRLEQLQADFNGVMEKINLPAIELPVVNASQSYSSDSRATTSKEEAYSTASIEKIALLYQRDVELLRYDY